MKAAGTTYWNSPNTDATNESGFSGLPGGFRDVEGVFYGIGTAGDGIDGVWWASTEGNTSESWVRGLSFIDGVTGRGKASKRMGSSVRCLRD